MHTVNTPTATRVRALRKRLNLTQEQIAQRSIVDGEPIAREEVNKLEAGVNKGESARIVRALATAASVSMDAMYEYLGGRLPLDRLFTAGASTPTAKYSDLPGWSEARARAQLRWQILPPEAFDAAEELPLYRPVAQLDDMAVLAIAAFSWFTMSPDEQAERATRSVEKSPTSSRQGLASPAPGPKTLPGRSR
jgi:transcriptional regulator with XRE-family HTH domain